MRPHTVLTRRRTTDTAAVATADEVRFGPGVPAVAEAPATPDSEAAVARRPRRLWATALWTLAIAIATVLLWLWLHPRHALAVSTVRVTVAPSVITCGQSAELHAVVTANGAHGTLSYRWRRSDGTTGPLQHYRVADGRHRVVLPLQWTIRGTGQLTATATVQLLEPSRHAASAAFRYACPG